MARRDLVAHLLIAFVFPFKQLMMGVAAIFCILLVQAAVRRAAIMLLPFAIAGMNPHA